ncbi:hypothetical protein THOB06_50021 [Vibrio rotiferianus]|nr:hypothetical protein THOG10_50021 [Vibrio rotiferianus]CAH1590885.1 hypothetical protein THOB06_50021 [Vibrio rotiferianus]
MLNKKRANTYYKRSPFVLGAHVHDMVFVFVRLSRLLGHNKKHLPKPRLEGGVECQIEGGIVNCYLIAVCD